MVQVLILEDNKESLIAITAMVQRVSNEIQVLQASTMSEALEIIKNSKKINAFLLDINLDEKDLDNIDGIELARNIRQEKQYAFTPIVMITSLANLELQAYRELHCYQYILKPYEEESVDKIIKDVLFLSGETAEESFVVKKDGINYKLLCKNLISVRAITRGIELTLVSQNDRGFEKMSVPYLTIKQLLEKLSKDTFIQCHRMFVVNKDFIDYTDFVNRIIHLTNEEEVEIGVTYKNEIKKRIS